MKKNKLYLVLNESINGIGGSYIYIMNKLNYYERNGYDVNVIHGGHAVFKTIIPKLKKFESNKEEEIRLPIHYLNKIRQAKYVNSIISKYNLDLYDEVIIESSTYNQATWGETISQKIGAKHIVLLLTEKPVITDINAYDFFCFKLKRRELCGIAQKSLAYLFKGWKQISIDESFNLPCYCNNSIDDVEFDYNNNLIKTDFTIGCLGRFDKPYFIPSLNDLKEYVEIHKDKTFTIILIGQAKSQKVNKQVDHFFDKCKNVQTIKMGSLFPIPLKLIQKANIFIASAGSCTTIRHAGVNVISYDGKDLKPIGIFQKTTEHSLFRSEDDYTYTLEELMNMVLFEKKYLDHNPVSDMKKINSIDFSSHQLFIGSSKKEKEYYDFNIKKRSMVALFSVLLSKMMTPHIIFKILDTTRKVFKVNFSVEQFLGKK